MTYDKLNRILTKTGPEGTTTFEYDDETTNGKGQISSTTGPNGITQNYEYDTYGRLIKSTEVVDSRQFEYSYSYDELGRESTITYPSGFGIVNKYNDDGYLEAVKNSDETLSIWEGVNYNALGQPLQTNLGNGQTVTKGYDNYHRLNLIDYSNYASLGYEYYTETGNLKSRTYTKGSIILAETFTYDNLNRLKTAQIGNNAPYLNMLYDDNGNITFKDDVGSYEYNHPSKPHAITNLVDLTSQIPIPSVSQDIDYNGFNKVERIEENGNVLLFTYGPDQLRRKTVLSEGSNTLLTKYFFGAYEEEITTSGTKKVHYISGGDGLVAVYITTGGITDGDYYYTYTDHLGSIIALADDAGVVTAENEQNFDPWGRRRNISDWGYTSENAITLLDRGFTGHQHLVQFGIINMNGRLYDPVLGRILSPDNFVQLPDFTQNFNRYSYCWNNPLIYIDPSGEFSLDPRTWLSNIFGGKEATWDNFSKNLGFENTSELVTDMYISQAIMTLSTIAGQHAGFFMADLLFPASQGFGYGFTYGFTSGFTREMLNGSFDSWILGDYSFSEGLEYGALIGLEAGLTDAVKYSTSYAGNDLKFWQFVLNNNISDNLDIFDGEKLRLHFTIWSYDFDGSGGHWIWSKGLSDDFRLDMGMEFVWGLSLIPNGDYTYNWNTKKKNKTTWFGDFMCKLGGNSLHNGKRYIGINYKWHEEFMEIKKWSWKFYKWKKEEK
jgi:RHS repeat-associated protein